MDKIKVLFVCSANYSRSVTAAKLANEEFGKHIEARSAGVCAGPRGFGGHQIDQSDMDWADEVVVMEGWHATYVMDKFEHTGWLIHSLGIADIFEPGDKKLVTMLGASLADRVIGKNWLHHGMKEDEPMDLSYLQRYCCDEEM